MSPLAATLGASKGEGTMPLVDLAFRLMGTTLPVDHGYALYSAINRLVAASDSNKGSANARL